MLHALEKHKLGRNFDTENTTQEEIDKKREPFTASEDSLTSSVFGQLLYLPVEMFWHILSESCYSTELPRNAGKLLEYEFWPKWSCGNNSTRSYVEPDVFLSFEELDLIIEAKRHDDKQQYAGQWEEEYRGYMNEYGSNQPDAEDASTCREVYIIAAGGLHNMQTQYITDGVPVLKMKWTRLLYEISSVLERIRLTRGFLSSSASLGLILQDTIRYFELHGYFALEWIEDGVFPTSPTYGDSIATLLSLAED